MMKKDRPGSLEEAKGTEILRGMRRSEGGCEWMCGCMCVVRNHNLQHMCRVCLRAGLDVRVLCASKSDINLGADEFDSRGGRLVEDEDGVELHAA